MSIIEKFKKGQITYAELRRQLTENPEYAKEAEAIMKKEEQEATSGELDRGTLADSLLALNIYRNLHNETCTIKDFNPEKDRLLLQGADRYDMNVTCENGNTLITFDGKTTTLEGIEMDADQVWEHVKT